MTPGCCNVRCLKVVLLRLLVTVSVAVMAFQPHYSLPNNDNNNGIIRRPIIRSNNHHRVGTNAIASSMSARRESVDDTTTTNRNDVHSLTRRQSLLIVATTALTSVSYPNEIMAASSESQEKVSSSSQPVVVSNSNNKNEFATSAGRKGCITTSDPAKTVVTCTGDLSSDQFRVSSISSTENGVSTSAIRNPARYASPWTYLTETNNATKAWQSLYNVVVKIDPYVKVIHHTDTYLHVTVPTTGSIVASSYYTSLDENDTTNINDYANLDDLEFILRPEENLILYRSASRTSIFIYPLTQPISDRDSNLKRLQKIRTTLGWQELT